MNGFYFLLSLMILDYCVADNEYYTYEKIDSTLHAWQNTFGFTPHPSNDYPGFGVIYNLDTIGYSSQDNLPIFAVKLSAHADQREVEPKVLILGQCHAEEIYGVEIAMEIIKQFLYPDLYQDNKILLQKGLYYTELWIVPTYNPEGLRVVHGYIEDRNEIKDVTYRKNKRDTNNNNLFDYVVGIGRDLDGVDLNRNYNFNWFFGDTLFQPCDPVVSDCSYDDDYDYYKGEYPESESEIHAIKRLANEQKFLLSIAYHSSRSGNVDKNVVYPWAWEGKSTIVESPGFDVISDLGEEIAELLVYSYFGGSKTRRGNAHDWLYREIGCIQYLIEVGYTDDAPYGEGLLIESDYLDEVLESNMGAFFHLLMRAAGQYYNNEFIGQEFDGGNQVRGIVTDVSTGLPIPDAIVKIVELEDEILKPRKTDEDGFFCRLLKPLSSYNIIISAYGYTVFDSIITASAGAPTVINTELIPTPIYTLTFNIQLPDAENTDLQLIILNSISTDTVIINHGESINLPQDNYKLIFISSEYFTQIYDIDLVKDIELSINLLSEQIIWEDNFSSSLVLSSANEELSIPLNNLITGDNLIIEINFRYELEWEYDYFTIQYINEDHATDIVQFTGDNYQFYTQYFPFTIPAGYNNGNILLRLNTDDTINYRGVEIDYIKIMKGSETLYNVADILYMLPENIQLHQNYPNPFNPTTSIKFSIPTNSTVSISTYNIRGEFIEELINDTYEPGDYEIIFNAVKYASGIYLYRLKANNSVITKKIIIVK